MAENQLHQTPPPPSPLPPHQQQQQPGQHRAQPGQDPQQEVCEEGVALAVLLVLQEQVLRRHQRTTLRRSCRVCLHPCCDSSWPHR